jgi:hypothetical protein
MNTPRIVTNSGQQQVHFGGDPSELPPLDLPEATEPPHWGSSFKTPSKWRDLDAQKLRRSERRERRERLTRMVIRAVWIAAAAAIVLALHPTVAGGA